MLRIVKLVPVGHPLAVLSALLASSSTPLPQSVSLLVRMVTIKIAQPEPVFSARLGVLLAQLLAPPAAPLALPSTSLLLSISAQRVTLFVTGVLVPEVLLVKPVPPIHIRWRAPL